MHAHLDKGAIVRTATIAQTQAPFATNSTTGLPTGGLEMPALVAGTSANTSHVSYWDVASRSLRLVLNAMGGEPRALLVASAAATTAGSNPGAWSRAVRAEGSSVIVLAFFDLGTTSLHIATCDDVSLTCTLPHKHDTVGHKDVSDLGAGAFPEFRQLRSTAHGPTLVYFSQGTGPTGQGQLKQLACADAACSSAAVTRLASGAAGYGRDPSLALTHDGALLVSSLDLMGMDDPDKMVAQLLVGQTQHG